MRIQQYKRIIQILETLSEAQAAGLYANCQESALGIGQYIEENVGTETCTVSELETYCELLYRVSIGEEDINVLNAGLDVVKASLMSEFYPRLEIAFISNNASMADSMESIYLAAKADEECDPYFISVPFHERNSNGTLGKMNYEGAEHNKAIEITNYSEYDMATRRPDIIFTNNPYDDSNFVTCVQPDYFTYSLKKHTEMLCFVPYFVPHISDGAYMAHGVRPLRFDFIAATSEDDYQFYRSAGIKSDVAVLGCAKLDRLFHAMQERPDIPGSWQSKIPEIRQKKTLALVSSLGVFANQSELYLQRLEEYISTIEMRNDIALIFRPHPLMEKTINAMFDLEVSTRYNTLLSRIEQGSFGVVDREVDFIPTIIYCDAFAGEMYSSLARMYALTGKPIFEMVLDRPQKNNIIRGGELKYSYTETEEFSLAVFLDRFVSGDIPPYDRKQEKYNRSLYANADGTAGKKIYEYVKRKAYDLGGIV